MATPALAERPMPLPHPQPAAAPAEPDAILLYGDATMGTAQSEKWMKFDQREYGVRNVTRPTLTPVLPDPSKATGAAVVVAPGGAFMALAIDREGWAVARALAARGIAAFVLKYRLNPTPDDEAEAGRYMGEQLAKENGNPMEGEMLRKSLAPVDAKAALALIRSSAVKWGIDPARVGIIGFSAGAMTARRVAIDASPSDRPAFVGYIYGPQDPEQVPADAPPLFDALALDDPLMPSKGFAIASAWMQAKRPVEIHGYGRGGHGFGVGVPGTTTALVIDEFTAWLSMQGFIARKDTK
jgi:acetyl esterase/lipase